MRLAAVAWLSSATVLTAALGIGVFQLAAFSATATNSGPKASPSPSPATALSGGNAQSAKTSTSTQGASPNGTSSGNNGSGAGNGGPTGTQANNHPIVVTGVVTGTPAPGKTATLAVTIDNAKNQAIIIRTVTAGITAVTTNTLAGKPACNKDWYHLSSFAGSQRVAAGAKAVIPLTISFTNEALINQDNCKGATYSFHYMATADQA